MSFFIIDSDHFNFRFALQHICIVSICISIMLSSCDTTENVKPYQDQTFIKLYGGNGSEVGNDLVLLPDGGFAATGSSTSTSSGSRDVYVVRTDNLGNVIWENRFDGHMGDDIGNSIIFSEPDNELFVCGESVDSSSALGFRDVFVLNLNADNGQLIGNPRRYGDLIRDEYGTDIIKLNNGGFFISATMSHPDTSKYLLIETDINLDTIPLRTRYVGTQGVNNFSIRAFENQGNTINPFTCFGSTFRAESAPLSFWFHSFLYRSDGDATILPEFYSTDNLNEICTDVARITDGGYILAGLVEEAGKDIEMVVKIDPNRREVWTQEYTNEFDRNIERPGIIQTLDGGYLVSSTIELDDPLNNEISLLKLNSEGQKEWRKTFGSNENDSGSKAIQLQDGSYVVVGTIGFGINPDSQSKMCLMKVNQNGELIPI